MARPSPMYLPSNPGGEIVISNGKAAEVLAFEREVVGFFVAGADLLGVPKSVAAIYGIIFASPRPLTFSEIEDQLAISKGSVSQGLKLLREIGAIKESEGVLKRYVPDLELRKLVARFIENRLGAQLKQGEGRLRDLSGLVPTKNEADAAELRRRLQSLHDWHRKANALLPVAHSLLKLG